MIKEEAIKNRLSKLLGRERFEHSLSVQRVAIDLARHHGIPEEKARLAGLLHDSARWMDRLELLAKAEELEMDIHPIQRLEPKLLHAPLSAWMAQEEFGIQDQQILSAIARHTAGAENMSSLDKIIYLADHIEPKRNFWKVDLVRSLAYKNMNSAIVECASSMIRYLVDKGLAIFPPTILTRNYYLMNPED